MILTLFKKDSLIIIIKPFSLTLKGHACNTITKKFVFLTLSYLCWKSTVMTLEKDWEAKSWAAKPETIGFSFAQRVAGGPCWRLPCGTRGPPTPTAPSRYRSQCPPAQHFKAKRSPAGKQRLFLDLVLAEKQILAIDWPQRASTIEEGFVCRLLRKRTLHKSTALRGVGRHQNIDSLG